MRKTILALLIGISIGILFVASKPDPQPIQINPTPMYGDYEIVKFCQELSAKAAEGWEYTNCLSELREAAGLEAKILKTT